MSLQSLIEKSKQFNLPPEILEVRESRRVAFVSKFPEANIINLTVDQYAGGSDKNTFCYWLEFKKILFGMGGGTAGKFGIYKSTDGNYYKWARGTKTIVSGSNLEGELQKILKGISTALDYVKQDRISEIRSLNVPIWPMILQKILMIYYPNQFISIGSADVMKDIAQDIGLQKVDISSNNLVQINYEINKMLRENPAFKGLDYETLSTLLWTTYRPEEEDDEPNDSDEINYWLYAPGENANKWDEFYSQGVMGLGWDQLGDLKNYKSKEEIASKLQAIESTTSSKKNDAAANFEFQNGIKIGDIIIAKKGRGELLGYGNVTSDPFYDSNRESYKNCRHVEWKNNGSWKTDHSLALKTLTNITDYSSEIPGYNRYYERLLALMNYGTIKTNYKDQFFDWLQKNSKNGSGKISSYVGAIERLSETIRSNIFEEDNPEKIKLLYEDLLQEQGKEDGKYYHKDAPGYGTSGFYSAAIKTYLNFINQYRLAGHRSSIALALNTILYGPPGTGKTYKLNDYKKEYFTDVGILKSSDDFLKEKAIKYPIWQILAAVLSSKNKYCSVSELMTLPLVKAKLEDRKTPQNTIWRILQSYADFDSSQMNEKYRALCKYSEKMKKASGLLLIQRSLIFLILLTGSYYKLLMIPNRNYFK